MTCQLDKIAEDHSFDAGFNGRMMKYRFQLIADYLSRCSPKPEVLDIGCGEGRLTEMLARAGHRMSAIEPAANYHARAVVRLAGLGVDVRCCTAETFSSETKFGAIVAAGVLEHAADAQVFLAACRELLRRDGVLILTVPNARSLHRLVGREMGLLNDLAQLSEQDFRVGHYRYYDKDSLSADMECAGFVPEILTGFLLKPLPNAQMSCLSDDLCDAYFRVGAQFPDYCAELFGVFRQRQAR